MHSAAFPQLHKHSEDARLITTSIIYQMVFKGESQTPPLLRQHEAFVGSETAEKRVECTESTVRAVHSKAGLAGGAGSPPWQMRSHYQADENSTSRISQLLCLSHGSVKLGTINR